MSAKDWLGFDRRHVWHPFTALDGVADPIGVERAEGVWFHTTGGRRILDGISSWWINVHGHGHPRLDAAIRAQLDQLTQIIFAGFTHEAAARLAERLVGMTPEGLERVFYSDDGSTAVEVALKMAVQYWKLRGEARSRVVALDGAYHGDTFGAMAAGGVPLFHRDFGPLLFEVERAPAPCPFTHGMRDDPAACAAQCLGELEAVLERHRGEVAAVIVEPMLQGAGGMKIFPSEYLAGLGELVRRHDTLLIADEVFTGFGRTGKLFASQHGPVVPDLLCLSKALTGGTLPLGVTMAHRRVVEAFEGGPERVFFHGHSFTANGLACAVALESLDLLEESSFARVAGLEARFTRELLKFREHPLVADARGIGGLAVLELRAQGEGGYRDALGPRLAREFLARDILLRPLGNVLYFLPPYVIEEAEVDRVFAAIEEVLDLLAQEG